MKIGLQNWFDENNVWPYAAVILSLILVSLMVFPLIDSMVLGVVFAYVGRPIKDLFGKRQLLGSLLATCCIVIPLFLVITLGTLEVANQLIWLVDHKNEFLDISSGFIRGLNVPPVFLDQLTGSLKGILDTIMSMAATVPLRLLNFVLSFLVCFFLLLDGIGLKNVLIGVLSPKKLEINQKYFAKIDQTLSGIFVGSIYTSIVGGIVSVIIFYLFDIPRPLAMASLVFLAGLVPFLTWIVFIPISIYRYFEYGAVDALIFFLVVSILVHLAEFFIRPYFVSTKSSLHPLLVMLTFIGGGLVAGITGFFLAPALTGIIYAIYRVKQYERAEGPNNAEEIALKTLSAIQKPEVRPPS
jgi:predicted PurR-regulated permease PerM